jgi:CheY-like chemotaxis protein
MGIRYQLSDTLSYQKVDSYETGDPEDANDVPPEPAAADFCVWVVEDDPLWRDQVGGLLAEMGIATVIVTHLQEVQTRLETGPAPALVCLDLAIPAQAGGVPIANGGLTALKYIRAHFPEVAVVVMSTQSHSPQLMAEALRERISLQDVLAKGDASGQWLTRLYQRLWLHQRRYRRLAVLGHSDGLPRIILRITDWQPDKERLTLAVNGKTCGPYRGLQARLLHLLLTAPQGGIEWFEAYTALYHKEPSNNREEGYRQLLSKTRKQIGTWPVDWGRSSPQQVLREWGTSLCLQVQCVSPTPETGSA